MKKHDPVEFAGDLTSRLATRSRKVCLFVGAGASKACHLPDVDGLERLIHDALDDDDQATFARLLKGRNFEEVLSRLRRIQSLLEDEDDQDVDGLTASDAVHLDRRICRETVQALSLSEADLEPMEDLARWIQRSDYHKPIEIFTVNYDLLAETALESRKVPYFDGFVGSLRARFETSLVEEWPGVGDTRVPATFVRLWKLHGSVHWAWTGDGEGEGSREVVRLGVPVSEGQAAAIYPSDTKYQESRRVPFVVLQDRFRRSLHQSETLVLITGYSFSDQHLNEVIFSAAARRPRSEFIAFCYGEIPESLVDRAQRFLNVQAVSDDEAIIGGVRGLWEEPDDPSPQVWANGSCLLPDFRYLAEFLARSPVSQDREVDERIEDLSSRLEKLEEPTSGLESEDNA